MKAAPASGVRLVISAAVATAVMLAATLIGTAAAGADQPGTIGGFSVHPAESNPSNPATRAYFIRSVRAGGLFSGNIVVVNSSEQPLELREYPVDGLTGVTSGVVYGNRATVRRAAGRWVHLATDHVTVPAQGSVEVAVTANVPRGTAPGEHLAGVAFETVHPTTTGGHFSITEIFRAVVGVELVVPGRAAPQVRLTGAALSELPGTNYPAMVVRLTNSGRDLCKPILWVWLAHHWVARHLDTVLPGDSIPYPFPWPRALTAGRYPATVKAYHCGRPQTLSTVASLGEPLLRNQASITPIASAPRPAASGGSWVPYLAFALAGAGIGTMLSRRARQLRGRAG